MLDVFGSLQLLNTAHVRERDKALLRSVMVGGVWNGFLLTFAAGKVFEVDPCLIFMALYSSLILLMFEKEIRLCFVASWLGCLECFSSWTGS